jgi:hypothetical protein
MKRRGDPASAAHQLDLFVDDRPMMTAKMPAWPELPAETRAALTRLMTRLILEHADKSRIGSGAEAGHDL